MLRKALGELRLWGLTREFAFADPAASAAGGGQPAAGGKHGAAPSAAAAKSSGGGASVRLIRGWGDVLGEVSGHQALVGSLKQSGYYHLFKVRPEPALFHNLFFCICMPFLQPVLFVHTMECGTCLPEDCGVALQLHPKYVRCSPAWHCITAITGRGGGLGGQAAAAPGGPLITRGRAAQVGVPRPHLCARRAAGRGGALRRRRRRVPRSHGAPARECSNPSVSKIMVVWTWISERS